MTMGIYIGQQRLGYLWEKIKGYVLGRVPFQVAIGTGSPYYIWEGTRKQYDSIETYDDSTIYLISTPPYDAEVEWLESNGTQYIDTGIVLTKNYKIEMDVAFTYKSGFQGAIGSVGSSSSYGSPLCINSSGNPYTQVGDGSSYVTFASSNYADSVKRHWILKGNGSTQYITYAGTTKSKAISGTLPSLTMYLFARSGASGAGNCAHAKIGETSIIINGILVRDFIPVRIGQVGYMYDKVSGELFGNDGTGSFTLGADV